MTPNTRGLPQRWKHGSLLDDTYTYDANGNVLSITDLAAPARSQAAGRSTGPAAAPAGGRSLAQLLLPPSELARNSSSASTTRTMGYDALNRLTSATGPWGTGEFRYDAVDNLVYSRHGTTEIFYDHDASNRLYRARSTVGTATFLYDANGNLRQRGQQGLTFDIGNRLLGSSFGTGHWYDGHGRRTWTQHGDGSWRLQMYSSAGRLMYARHLGPPDVWTQGRTLYLYIQDRLVAEYRPDAAQDWLQFVHTDALGTPVVRSGAAAPAQEIENSRRWFRPHGFTPLMPNTSEVGYTGHFYDTDTTLVYMQQRYYDPVAGRFLSVDPVTTNAKDGSFFGRYHYANNNPYKFKDPDGRAADLALDLVFIAADLVDIGKNGLNLSNGVSLAGNLVGAAIPFATGVGKLASTAVTAGKVADTTSATRSGALAAAKEANGIPRSAQPDAVIKPGTPAGNAAGLDSRNVRQYEYTNSKGEKISIREDKATSSEKGSQPHHFNAGPSGEKLKQHHFVDEKQK